MSVIQYKGDGQTKTVLYSGDLGRFNKPIIKDPTLNFAEEHEILISWSWRVPTEAEFTSR